MIPDGVGNIYLVGFMGSGKTTVGRLLAAQLGHAYLDLDGLVEARAGETIASIFENQGEGAFRKLEREVFAAALKPAPHVMALGGGAFTTPSIREAAGSRGWTVWLQVGVDEAWRRCLQSGRPLARDREGFEQLYARRQPDYARSALRVETEGRTPGEVCAELLTAILEATEKQC